MDVNDRELRQVVVGLGGRTSGVPRQDGFDITVASELMAILCLATSLTDLKKRISKMLIGYTYDRQPVTVADLHVQGALTLLLKDAIKPNLVQTIEHTPAFIMAVHLPTLPMAVTVFWLLRQLFILVIMPLQKPDSVQTLVLRNLWTL